MSLNQLTVFAMEFVQIVAFLQKRKGTIMRGEFLWVEKKILVTMLEKNQYLPAEEKLKNWKKLRWIDADENRFTRRITIDGKRKIMVKISLSVYEILHQNLG